MKWGLVGKGSIPHVASAAAELREYLESIGESVQVEAGLAEALDAPGMAMSAIDADMILTVGGDGTILHAAQETSAPILGVNAGAIGFLAEIEPPMAQAAIDKVLAGEYRIDERKRLAVELDGKRLPDALNELTLQTSRIAKLIRFCVRVDGEILDTFRGDGMIVSTPTGSTGYAMSVGGPLVHPRVDCMVLAPIAPFRLAARPWVVPQNSEISIKLLERDSAQGIQQARVVVDGQHGYDMDTNSVVTAGPSDQVARFVRLGSGFYERVRTKLTR